MVDYAITGPNARASGVPHDLRRTRPYSVYPELDFDVCLGQHGDVYDRYKVRIEEMSESRKIILQCLDMLPKGPVQVGSLRRRTSSRRRRAAAYTAQENPRGEYGTYIVSDGSRYPYRLKYPRPVLRQPADLPQAAARQQDRRRGGHLGQHGPGPGRHRPLMHIFLAILRCVVAIVIAYMVVFVAALVNISSSAASWPSCTDRLGPNRTGWQGVLQSVADAFKMMGKEDFAPAQVDKVSSRWRRSW